MDGVFETQPDRTDLPLVVMPVVIESMIGPFKQNFTMLENVARVRMHEDFTLDEDTIVERCKDADAVMVIGFHCADAILDRLDAKCYAFGGTRRRPATSILRKPRNAASASATCCITAITPSPSTPWRCSWN